MFSNILIPVDFHLNTEIAVKKALELADPGQTVIHLFHVQTPPLPWNSFLGSEMFQIDLNQKIPYQLKQWKDLISDCYPEMKVAASAEDSMKIQKSIIAKAKIIKAELIIIGKHSHHNWFPFLNTVFPNKIAKATGCPVLTFKPGSIYTKIRSIVVPVGPEIPRRKVDLIVSLNEKFRITIHLVTVINKKQNQNNFSAYSLLETYRFLKDFVQCPLNHEVLHGENVAKAIFEYAKSIKADVLLVEPESETKLSSFPQKHINDELKPNSKLQILAVQS
ncbi:MAG TPA: universal stress protein [Chitinophagaceae bacterium]|nr:universal stress protein [Chitinophagaceae bacterium]